MFVSEFFATRFLAGVAAGATLLLMMGCGGSTPDCGVTGLNVGPAMATVSHTAAAPANSQVFSAMFQFNTAEAQNGCVTSALTALVNSNWTASDPSVQLSASPSTQVTATCTAAVANPVTITATAASGTAFTAQASLTCN